MDKLISSLREKIKEHPKNWKRALNLIWKASPYYTVFWAVLLIILGVLPGLSVYLTKHVVDNLVTALNSQGEWGKIYPAIFFIGAVALVLILTDVSKSLLEIVRTAQADFIQDCIKGLIHDKSAVIDMADFESHEFHDRLEQATSDGANRPLSLLENIGGLVQNFITLFIMTGLLIQYGMWMPLALLISTVPIFIIVLRYDRQYHKWWRQTTSIRRWIQYFDIMLTHNAAVAEMRVFKLNPHFQANYQKQRKTLRTERLAQMRRLGIAKLIAGIFSLLILGAAVAWMAGRALYGYLTLGDLALFYQAFNYGQSIMRNVLGSLGKLIKDSLFINILFEFLDLKSKIADPKIPVTAPKKIEDGIQIRNISFSYPNTKQYIFRDFSLFIPAGKSIAVVGENGSGKTTLLKLICRFYDPESGSIEFDGVDIRSFSVKELLRLITITFQMPLNYHATVRETIAMGDLEAKASFEKVEKAARRAGAHDFISRLPDKYETLLGRIHAKGAELSGGEWQRLALARAYYRQAPIVLLDEPTSFMDSWSESDWFQRFRDFARNRTALIITHRFTIAMRADVIFVMDKGQIIESGTHHELLKLDGFYAKSWKEQMQAGAAPLSSVSENGHQSLEDVSLLH